jgi:hypothetical protein
LALRSAGSRTDPANSYSGASGHCRKEGNCAEASRCNRKRNKASSCEKTRLRADLLAFF